MQNGVVGIGIQERGCRINTTEEKEVTNNDINRSDGLLNGFEILRKVGVREVRTQAAAKFEKLESWEDQSLFVEVSSPHGGQNLILGDGELTEIAGRNRDIARSSGRNSISPKTRCHTLVGISS